MKKWLAMAIFAVALCVAPSSASAHDYNRNDSDHPLRYVGYALHPIGIAIEYTVLRPIHHLVSQPNASIWFGHEPREKKDHDYHEWK